ncbi:MAG: MarR family transcriptional regulator [Bacteroidia bacterium]
MKLEDEIKQTKPFKNEIQKLILNINFTSSWLNALLVNKLKAFKISPQQYNVLKILKGHFPGTYSNLEITQRMIDKSSNVTRIVDKLVLKGLVNRSTGDSDRRSVRIEISKKGLTFLDKVESDLESTTNMFNIIDQAKAKIMNEWLDEMREQVI